MSFLSLTTKNCPQNTEKPTSQGWRGTRVWSIPCCPGGSPAPFCPTFPLSLGGGWGESHTLLLVLHIHIGAHLHTRPPWPHLPPSPCVLAADVAVVSRPQRCRLEPGRPVLCGYSRGWVEGSPPANKHTQRSLLFTFYLRRRVCVRLHTDGWAPGWLL